jgi:hypothetical protein
LTLVPYSRPIQYVQDEYVQGYQAAAVEKTSLTTVQEDEMLEDLKVSSHPETKTTVTAKTAQTVESKSALPVAVQDVRPGRNVEVTV